MKYPLTLILILCLLLSCNAQVQHQDVTRSHDEIINKYLKNGAWKHAVYSNEWQEEIDKGLAEDSTVAYLWQQKAMPLFKQGKYELGMKYIDKAVLYDPSRWHEYRAFIKCIFAKNYSGAIADFEDCKTQYGNNVVMDHYYDFYIALSYLQLNEFRKAEEILTELTNGLAETKSEEWVHHLDLFYLGVARYEQKNYSGAIEIFDRALKKYPQFSDVQYYKSICLKKLGDTVEAEKLMVLAEKNAKTGYTINEDSERYERYPYQVRWNF